MAVVVPACFGFACSCLVDIRTHGWCLQGGFRGCDGLPDLPTATAAAVITGKLGGSASSLTTYTLLSNVLAAIVVPLMFPLVEPHADITFVTAFLKILSKVFPLLLCPFFLAMLFRYFLSGTASFPIGFPRPCFLSLGCRACHRDGPDREVSCRKQCSGRSGGADSLAGVRDCAVQFYLGKRIGTRYSDRISAGQALGQKNTVLAIWMLIPIWTRFHRSAPDHTSCGKIFLTVISCGRREKMIPFRAFFQPQVGNSRSS